MRKVRWIPVLVNCLAIALGATGAKAAYPEHPVQLVTGFAPGGSTDGMCRIIAKVLSDKWGQPVIDVSKPGAGGLIAGDVVAHATPDGYTLLCLDDSFAVAAAGPQSKSFDPIKAFAPIARAASSPRLLYINPAVTPFNTLGDFIAYAKANPGKLNVADSGEGSGPYMATADIMRQTGIVVTHVAFSNGTAASLAAVLGGEIQASWGSAFTLADQVKAGKLKVLAVSSAARSALMPDVPTIAEAANLPGFENVTWVGISAPAGTPPDIIAKIHDDLVAGLVLPDTKQTLDRVGFTFTPNSSQEFAAFVAKAMDTDAILLKAISAK